MKLFNNKPTARNFVTALVIVILFWAATPSIIRYFAGDIGKSGQVGDAFGAVNALFSGLAFIGVAFAVWYQKIQLDETRELVTQQNFDSAFFKMIDLHHSIVSHIRFDNHEGRKAISALYEDYKRYRSARSGSALEDAQASYSQFHDAHSDQLAHYFRNLYRIMKYLDESSIANKRIYSGILRAQLSRDELRLLFYSGIGEKGSKFKPLIERYALVEHLPYTELYYIADTDWYDRKAFGDQTII